MSENAGVDPRVTAAEEDAYPPPDPDEEQQDQTMVAEDPDAPEPPIPDY